MLHLYNTFELLAVATSNSHFIFCFCNFIIAFLLIGSSSSSETRSSKNDNAMIDCPPSLLMDSNSDSMKPDKEEPIVDQGSAPADDRAAVAELECVRADQEDDEEQAQDDDDEFKRRIEQFIDKINRDWKAEKLRTQQLARKTKMSYQ